jgi:nucleotide-binding universal stress UspA family protein
MAAETHALDVEPGEGLVGLASSLGADLIVVGNRFLGGVQGYFMGSVPAKVLRHAPCSVLVVHTTELDDGSVVLVE